MARPCNSVDAEEHYRRLERLLAELYLVLRALLAQGAPLLPPPNHHPPPQPPPNRDSSGPSSRGSRGGRGGGSQRPAGGGGGSEAEDRCGGHCGGRQMTSAVQSCHKENAAWDAIGHNLKNIADTLAQNRRSKRVSSNNVVSAVFESDPLLHFCEKDAAAPLQRNRPFTIT